MTSRLLALSLVLSVLVALALGVGGAAATVVKEGGPPVGAKAGGAPGLFPNGAVRLQCWQHGDRIIDESDLRDTAIDYFDSSSGLRFRRGSAPDRMVMLLNPAPETTCLLQEEKPE
jgi:hypothetical protein